MSAPSLAPAASSMNYTGALTCAMQCTDLDKTIAWYNDVLGFALLFKVDEIGWCEMVLPTTGATIGFGQSESPEVVGGATPVFGVEDIDAARGSLEQKNVRFDGETITYPGMVSLATFFDPDGNKFMLSQDLT